MGTDRERGGETDERLSLFDGAAPDTEDEVAEMVEGARVEEACDLGLCKVELEVDILSRCTQSCSDKGSNR